MHLQRAAIRQSQMICGIGDVFQFERPERLLVEEIMESHDGIDITLWVFALPDPNLETRGSVLGSRLPSMEKVPV